MPSKMSYFVSTALSLSCAAPAFAQANAGAAAQDVSSSDIVVTATRREERLQDVPIAVTAIGSETLRTRGIASVGDLGTGRVPGLVVTSMQGTETSISMYVRGFGAGDASQGTQDLPVALYIDGVNVPRAQGAGIDLVTPERIEVLRGPQGQLFGRNAHSGAVQVVSKRPTGDWEGDFSASMGTFNTKQFKARLDLPEIAGFRIQLSGNYRSHDGYMHNPYNPNYTNVTLPLDPQSHFSFKNENFNGDFFALKTYGGRIAIERDIGDLNVFYSYDNTWAKDDQGISVLYRSKDSTPTVFNGFSPTQLGPLTFSNMSGPGGSTVTFINPLQGNKYPTSAPYGSPRFPYITKNEGHILNLTYAASDSLTLRSITGQRIVSRHGGALLNAVTSPFMSAAFDYVRSKMFSQEFQAIFTTENFNLTTGALYFKEDVLDERTSGLAYNCLGTSAPSATCAPGTSQATTAPHSINGFKRTLSDTKAYGLYAQGTYNLGPVDLTAGIRYSNDTKKGARVIDRLLGIDETAGLGTVRRNRFHTSRFDPAFTVKYNFNEDVNAYVRYAVGYRDGGSSVRSVAFTSFDEDEIKSWEVGFKSQLFDRRVTFNVAAFHNTIKGQQLSIQSGLGLNPPNVSLTDVINSPVDRKIKGFEVELSARLLPGLTISGSYAYLKSDNVLFGYDLATLAPFAPKATFSPEAGLIPDAATIAAHPNSQIMMIGPLGTPKHSGSINLDYVLPISDSNLLFHVDWSRTTNFINASPELAKTQISSTGALTVQSGYNGGASTNRVNARIAFRDIPLIGTSAKGEFGLWAKNMFNHVDQSFAFISGLNSPTILQPPRTIGADFRITF